MVPGRGVGSVAWLDGAIAMDVPWFPENISEVRKCCTTLFKYGAELGADHPGYGDQSYVERRREIAELSKNYH